MAFEAGLKEPLSVRVTLSAKRGFNMSLTDRPSSVEGGELVARTLARAGVSTVFTLHGGHLESFYRGCRDHDIELVDFRHEASAGHAAESYARVTGEIGVCAVTAGPGFANVVPAILNALVDQTPMLFLIGAPPLRERETNELQGGFDQLAMATPMAKWAVTVTVTERIPDLLSAAIRRAVTGRRGPVVVELPIDVLHMIVPESRATQPTGLNIAARPVPSRQEIQALIEMLLQAKRPAIVVGGEARFDGATAPLLSLLELARVPVFASKRGLGIVPAGHASDAHDAANLGSLGAKGMGPDLVVLAGVRTGLFLGGAGGDVLPFDARIAQITIDPVELGRIRDVDLPIVAHVGRALEELALAAENQDWPDWTEWREAATAAQWRRGDAYSTAQTERGIHPFHAMAEVAAVAGTNTIWAIDGGEAGQWAVQHARTTAPGRVITTGYFGGLGVGPGFALGAHVTGVADRVVLVTGDGSFGFHIQELDIMVHQRRAVVTVVLNNGIWGMSLHGQQIMYGPDYHAISTLPGRDYSAIARGFGCHAERVADFADLRPALERAFAADGPAVVEVLTDPEVVSPGLIKMLGEIDATDPHIMIPYYQNIAL
jgi:acetolactate synthase-1/2/3 large subunit